MKKGNQRYFGMRTHVGMNRGKRPVSSIVLPSDSIHDSKIMNELLYGKE
ncbi:MAG: hypothetical protein JXA46_01940 [Dehalococcoidales bacterium]|nr:hypothetical protein [Dehalococcoidales bacterium]